MIADQGLPRPDIAIHLDVDFEKFLSTRKEVAEDTKDTKSEYLKSIREGYKRFEKYHYWKVVDANSKKEKVHLEIVSQIESLINDYKRGGEDFENNFYPHSIGEDLFMYNNI
jgi:thymidylate kinase